MKALRPSSRITIALRRAVLLLTVVLAGGPALAQNVGIGTTLPSTALDVRGTFRLGAAPVNNGTIIQPNAPYGSGLFVNPGQSFTLPAGVTITSVEVYVYGGAGTFQLFQGTPGGTVLASQAVTYAPYYGLTSIVLATPITTTTAGTYSFSTGLGSTYAFYNNNDATSYADGISYAGATAYPSYDLKFAVRYTVAGSNNTILYATGTGQVGVGTASPTAMLDVAGSARLRGLGTAGTVVADASGYLSTVPTIKTLELSSTLPAAGGQNLVPHGLTDTKILSVTAMAGPNATGFNQFPPNFTLNATVLYAVYIYNGQVVVQSGAGNTNSGLPVRIFITYKD
jgi:hypothetical protein